MTRLLLLAALLAGTVSARAQLPAAFTSGPWKLTALGFDYEGDGKADRDMWKPCRAGTAFTFHADGTGSNYKGPQPCGNPGTNPLPFTWAAEGPNGFRMTQGPECRARDHQKHHSYQPCAVSAGRETVARSW